MSNHKAWTLPTNDPVENALLIAAYLVGREKVREVGNNRGYWVQKFLAAVGLGPGYAWCAAFVTYCLKESGWKGPYPLGAAAVRNWAALATKKGWHVAEPKRGDLMYWLSSNGTGHIGFVVSATTKTVETLEGNTSSGEAGSQRDGDGAYRRTRPRTSSMKFIRLPR